MINQKKKSLINDPSKKKKILAKVIVMAPLLHLALCTRVDLVGDSDPSPARLKIQ